MYFLAKSACSRVPGMEHDRVILSFLPRGHWPFPIVYIIAGEVVNSLRFVSVIFSSGASIAQFPTDGVVIRQKLNHQGNEVVTGETKAEEDVPVLGLHGSADGHAGRIVLYGDSNCLDNAHMEKGTAPLSPTPHWHTPIQTAHPISPPHSTQPNPTPPRPQAWPCICSFPSPHTTCCSGVCLPVGSWNAFLCGYVPQTASGYWTRCWTSRRLAR